MSTTGRCPYCGRLGTGEPCNPACEAQGPGGGDDDGIRSTDAHDKKHHPLSAAHSAVATPTGALVYVVCGFDGCPQRLEVDRAVWEAEEARRRAAATTPAGRIP